MENILYQLLASPFGSFAFVLGLILGGGWLIHYVTKKITEITSSHSVLANNVRKIEKDIDEIRKDIAYMKGMIQVHSDLVQSHSPLSLTEKGKEISQKMRAESIIAKNWSKIVQTLETETIGKSDYDIQQYCMEVAAVEPEKFFDEESVNTLKSFAYNNGKPYPYFSAVLAVIIRDKYFELKNAKQVV